MNSFEQRKKDVLGKEDKSAKGSWDLKIVDLCEKINSLDNYYTTSSCSGKCVIMEEKTGKDGSYYLWTSHEEINFEELKKVMEKNIGDLIKFKCESPILFVGCDSLESAKELLDKAKNSGFKQTGISFSRKLIGVEIRSGEKLEFPLIKDGKVLVTDEFLKVVVKEANKKLVRGWEKIVLLSGKF